MATPDDALEMLFWHFAEPGRLKPGNEGEIYTWTIQNRPIPPGWHWEITDGDWDPPALKDSESWLVGRSRPRRWRSKSSAVKTRKPWWRSGDSSGSARVGSARHRHTWNRHPAITPPSDDGYRLEPRGR